MLLNLLSSQMEISEPALLLEGEIDGQATTNVPTIVDLAEVDSINKFFEDTGDESFLMFKLCSSSVQRYPRTGSHNSWLHQMRIIKV